MGHHDNHNHPDLKGKRLVFSIILNIGITAGQIYGGIVSGSLSLLSDALHNFSDVMALFISYIGNEISKKKFSKTKTFGFKRAEILAAFINTATLIFISIFLIKESVIRFMNLEVIKPGWVIGLSLLSVFFNGLSVLLLKEDSKDNMNMKSAYLHLFTDMLSSFSIFVGGLAMYYFKIYWLDPLLTILIGLYLMYTGIRLLLKTIRVLMQFSPVDIDIDKIQIEIQKFKNVQNIHHVHIWELNDKEVYMEAHIDIKENLKLSEIDSLLNSIREMLKLKFGISHTTLQPEFGIKDSKKLINDHS
tara:strand:- start:2978 stop:3886 length:909 start_codon:yes stop_codon:yes gene_type:complete